ncbi:hypothetical protein [Prosthecobacter sp.]|uniref:hypothetical protein n=1 Tax=Prosthecobacter sp. TaxID=1965333 RepID=UPI00378460F6
MNEVYESALMKARKLAALAAAGVGGERANALEMLERHLRRHRLSLDDLRTDDRKRRVLECFDVKRKPMVNADLAALGVQCLAYVLNEPVKCHTGNKAFPWVSGKGRKAKPYAYGSVLIADLTDMEEEDWRACFGHFMPDFLATQKAMKAALKKCLSGFVHQHQIFRDTREGEEGPMLSEEELEALAAAMGQAQGSKWKRPAGRLVQSDFLLGA